MSDDNRMERMRRNKREWAARNRARLNAYGKDYYQRNKRNWQPGGKYAVARKKRKLASAIDKAF